jgi:hypothetical protein
MCRLKSLIKKLYKLFFTLTTIPPPYSGTNWLRKNCLYYFSCFPPFRRFAAAQIAYEKAIHTIFHTSHFPPEALSVILLRRVHQVKSGLPDRFF